MTKKLIQFLFLFMGVIQLSVLAQKGTGLYV